MENKKFKNKGPKPESYDRQTRMSWATLLNSYEDITPDFLPFFNSLHQNTEAFPYSIITPSYEGFMQHSTEMLVCLTNDILFIANKNETLETALQFKLDDILHVQFRTVLLDSNLKITGYNSKREPVTVVLRFNTVSDFLFKKIVRMIRLYSFNKKKSPETDQFEEFRSENFKFSNFAEHCLLPGEKVIKLIWQPELLQNLFHFYIPFFSFPFFRRRIFPNHLLMLTDQELILISEDNHHSHDDRYGGIWDFIAIEKIKNILIEQDQDRILTLSINLLNAQPLESRFLPSFRAELEMLMNNLNKK